MANLMFYMYFYHNKKFKEKVIKYMYRNQNPTKILKKIALTIIISKCIPLQVTEPYIQNNYLGNYKRITKISVSLL